MKPSTMTTENEPALNIEIPAKMAAIFDGPAR